ncbi:MAG: hypothetical protein JST54_30050 [Deltaproteobacteria bacterium]|nr:hypothetical protein [Deltaproteobacteria bacterium]
MSIRTNAVALAAVAALGCGTRSASWDAPIDVVGPVVAANELVWLNRSQSVAEVLDPSGAKLPMGLDVLALPRTLAATPNGFVITGGRGDAPLFDAISLPDGTRRSLTVGGAYDHIAVSDDGHYAVLSFDPAIAPAPGGPAARNNNQITVVDLFAFTQTTLSLNTESLAPEKVIFSPGDPVAAVVMDGTIVLLALDQPTHQVQVPLKLPDGTVLHPQQTLFAPDGKYLYVRTANSDDVLALEVDVSDAGIESAVNFLFFPGASGLVDIAVPQGAGFNRYVAALYQGAGSGTAALLDATGNTSLTHVFSSLAGVPSHFADLGGGALLIYPSSGTAVAGWEPLVDRTDTDILPAAPNGSPLVSHGHAFFVHASVSTSAGAAAELSGVTLVDDGSRLVLHQSPLELDGSPTASAIDPASGLLLLGVPVNAMGSGAAPVPGEDPNDTSRITGSVVTVQPDSLALGGLVLDDGVVQMGVAGTFGFATHQSALGDVTFFPLQGASRADAMRVYGFLAGHLADQGQTP